MTPRLLSYLIALGLTLTYSLSPARSQPADWTALFLSESTSPSPSVSRPQSASSANLAAKPKVGIEEKSDLDNPQAPKGVPDDRRYAKADPDRQRVIEAIKKDPHSLFDSRRAAETGRDVVSYGYLNGNFTKYTYHPSGDFEWEPEPRGPTQPANTQTSSTPAYQRAAQGVPSQQSFPGLVHNPSHTCPNCNYTSPAGQGTWVVRGQLPNGEHIHSCPQCGTGWRH
jgi:hypothetical protein